MSETPLLRPVVVVGAGLAGLTVALELARARPVVVLAKRGLSESATARAQGGIMGRVKRAGLMASAAVTLGRVFLLRPKRNPLPAQILMAPAW